MSEPELPSTEGQPPVVTLPTKSRITVVDNVYHQVPDGPPSTVGGDASRFSRELDSDEQVYERHKVAKNEWEPLDCGWIDKCGMLVVRNDEGHFAVNPTEEQRKEVYRRIVEVSFDGVKSRIQVPPQETCRFYPTDVKSIFLRCREGNARYTLCLVPE